MDFKYKDVREMKDREIAVAFINGAIRTDEQEEMAHLLRKKAQMVVAFGSCSYMGGIPGLGNFWDRKTIFETAYGKNCPSIDNPDKVIPQKVSKVPEGELTLPGFHDTVKSLGQVVDVDYYLPGCAPPPYLIMKTINAILSGELPEKGTVLAPVKTLCDTCSRNDSKPEKISIKEIKRISLTKADPEKCLLAEGIICMGPVTRAGCSEEGDGRCITVNMPCRGCFGPPPEVKDMGAKMISALASLIGLEGEEDMSEEDVEKLINQVVDPAGTFYRFSLPTSLLRRKRISNPIKWDK